MDEPDELTQLRRDLAHCQARGRRLEQRALAAERRAAAWERVARWVHAAHTPPHLDTDSRDPESDDT